MAKDNQPTEAPTVSPDTASAVATEQPENKGNTNSKYQNYYLPEYGISVKARSIKEAINKAEKQGSK